MSVVACKKYEDRYEIVADSILVRGVLQTDDMCVNTTKLFEENGVIAPFMNYPVRKAMHQIRIAVSASHTDDQISQLLGLLKQWKDKHESN